MEKNKQKLEEAKEQLLSPAVTLVSKCPPDEETGSKLRGADGRDTPQFLLTADKGVSTASCGAPSGKWCSGDQMK